jgi:vacuolar-type H+-ATPase subunit C/Vma6
MNSLSYAIGRIRSMEAYLLDDESILRIASSRDFEGAFSVLSENRFWASQIQKLETAFGVPVLADRAAGSLLALMRELCPKQVEINAMASRYFLRLTQASYLSTLEKAAVSSQSAVFKRFVAARRLFASIKNQLMGNPGAADAVIKANAFSDYSARISSAAEELKRSGSLARFDREEDNACMQIVRAAKYSAFGVDPIIGYFSARETEIKNIHLILSKKRLGLPLEDIKPRLRMSYV